MEQTTNTENLLKLIKENPSLPIVLMVDYEVVGGDYGRWLGSFGSAYAGEYAVFNENYYNDRDDFKEDYYNYNEEHLTEKFDYDPTINLFSNGKYTKEERKHNEEQEKLLEKYLEEIADNYFKKAIIVDIDIPDVDMI